MLELQTKPQNFISWIHFGDLHIQSGSDENYLDFQDLITEVNQSLTSQVDFAFLPGDNAEDGSEDQYVLVRNALARLEIPVHAIAGDHDRKGGSLDLFKKHLHADPFRAITLRKFRLIFLNALDGQSHREFDLSMAQMQWLEKQLQEANIASLRPVLFMHLYPSELATQNRRLSQLIRDHGVEMVEMGHTHYNELANDGHTIYATTRSTGQSEEGPPGFSLTVIDDAVISWKFKERGCWPFVMITSPSDWKLITEPALAGQAVRGSVSIRARVFGTDAISAVTFSIDGGPAQPMRLLDNVWQADWNPGKELDGVRQLMVRAFVQDAPAASDEVSVLVGHDDEYQLPQRSPIDSENAIDNWACRGIVGTQLGPNKNGTKGPWPSWRRRSETDLALSNT